MGSSEKLLTGTTVLESDMGTGLPPPGDAQDGVDAWLRARTSSLAATSPLAARYNAILEDTEALRAHTDRLAISAFDPGCSQLANNLRPVFDVFESGLARTALVEYRGWCDQGWDTHAENHMQSNHFEELFQMLAMVLDDLDGRTSSTGGALKDEVTLCILSEMGRTPKLNNGGRDHWTYTSAMLIGAGVEGGQVIGGYDEYGYGSLVDLESGEVTDGGTGLDASNLGGTLLALGDVDPGENTPIPAAIT
jgi:hypothetical protein